jgi:hypothetical protein
MPDVDEFGPFKADAAKLHLRTSDRQLFGPVPLSTLRHWAAEGRVSGGDEVSHDQTLWVRVESLPDLKLVWNGARPDGSPFGPFNLLAVPLLVQRGLIGPHSYLRNCTTGKQLAVDALLRLENRDLQDGALLSTPPPVHAESASSEMAAGFPPPPGVGVADNLMQQKLQESLASMEAQISSVTAKLDAAREENSALQTQARLRLDASRLQEQEFIRQNSETQDGLRRELEQERSLRTEAARRSEEEVGALREEISELQRRLAASGAETAKLQDELLARKLELYSGEEARSEREQQLEKQLGDEKERHAATAQDIAEIEVRRGELERSLAELRQTRETEASDASQRLQQLEQTILALEARQSEIAAVRASAQELERRTSESMARIEAAESQTRAASARLEKLQSAADSAERERSRLAEEEGRRDVERSAEHAREAAQKEALLARVHDLEEESGSSVSLLEQVRLELEDQRRKCKELKESAAAAQAGAAELDELKRALADERAAGEAARAAAAAAEEEGRRKLSEAESRREQARAELAAQQAAASKFREESEQRAQELQEKAASVSSSFVPASWYLKIDEASVFGPIVLADLQSWTTEGRIGPQHLVSRDQQQWGPASDLPELGMDWMVSLPDGTAFGPLSLGAIRTLVKDGTVTADARIAHRTTQEAWTAERLMNPAVFEMQLENERLAGQVRSLEARRRGGGKS